MEKKIPARKSLFIVICGLLSLFTTASASDTSQKLIKINSIEHQQDLPNLYVSGYTVINQSSNTILASHNDQVKMPPASLTKLMTLFIAYDYLEKGLIHKDEKVYISKKAWKTEGSRMFVEPESEVQLDSLLRGVSIVSGNDASIAVAEHIAGTEKNFVKIMNQKVASLGLTNTHFENATGLPHPKHLSTPYDMSIIAKTLIQEHPEILKHTKEKSMTYKNIKQNNRNKLLWSDETVFGLKTGHTKDAGYCLVATAKRNNQTIIATVFGANSEKKRDSAIKKLINHAQNGFQNINIADDKKISSIPIWYGQETSIKPKMESQIQLSIRKGDREKIRSQVKLPKEIKAPITKGQIIGSYEILSEDSITHRTNLIADHDVKTQNSVRQIIEWFIYQAHCLTLIITRQN